MIGNMPLYTSYILRWSYLK